MKLNEITLDYVKEYLKIYDDSDDTLIKSLMVAAVSYIKNYTGLSDEQINLQSEFTIAFLLLVSDFYDNRSGSVANNLITNNALKSILDMHSINLL